MDLGKDKFPNGGAHKIGVAEKLCKNSGKILALLIREGVLTESQVENGNRIRPRLDGGTLTLYEIDYP